MTINVTPAAAAVFPDSNADQLNKAAAVDLTPEPFALAMGTYSVHTELCISVPYFYESAYAQPHPWQERQSNFSLPRVSFGHFRSIYNVNGDYQNFYDIFGMSCAPSFYERSPIPNFYADSGNCKETSFVPPRRNADYRSYRPFAIESRGYTRSYFFGIAE